MVAESRQATTDIECPLYPATLAPDAYYQGKPVINTMSVWSAVPRLMYQLEAGLTERIKENLLPVFAPLLSLPTTRSVLEIASGEGSHSLVYSRAFPDVTFQPTECDKFNIKRIDRTCQEVAHARRSAQRGGVRQALELDVAREDSWQRFVETLAAEPGEQQFDLIIGHNFLHMIPFPQGAERIFRNLLKLALIEPKHGQAAFYGPFKHDRGFFSQADEEFDREISSRPSSHVLGLRSIQAIARIAADAGWELAREIPMPRGNWVLLFKVKSV
ncbi:uncharacterized protein JCM15063_000221 [Sporobolomyces koalae]|uniref:uncharacterized protein n=1 Tax=Sporobolomyces koalae TaxID=500713 RepID=UPI00316BBDD6